MVKVASYFAMSFAAFLFWQSMDHLHVWIALHQDEKKERLEKEMEIKRMRDELLAKAKQEDSLIVGLIGNIRHVVIKSATPQLSKKVLSLTEENNSFEKALISLKPILIIAA
ncbi:hypothetical protein J5N97_007793 [Dioscorea zingiberensis]|uniref:Uncharacterized protein n=1 Tax=Dioscorea zingiberensis TaxID=325984 RepID=A0A9D5DH81_9LILI|nr:hypothetical protein J5N97_007793 [Dioscorea zingiberensis]